MLAIEAAVKLARDVQGHPFNMHQLLREFAPDHGHFMVEVDRPIHIDPNIHEFSFNGIEGRIESAVWMKGKPLGMIIKRGENIWDPRAAAATFWGIDCLMDFEAGMSRIGLYVNFQSTGSEGVFLADIPIGEGVERSDTNIAKTIILSRDIDSVHLSATGQRFMNVLDRSRLN